MRDSRYQMQILGIDYGRKKVGLAIGDTESRLAQPLKILRYLSLKEVEEEIGRIVRDQKIEKIVLGVPDGEIERESRKFGENLKKALNISIEYTDETLSTKEAQSLSIQAGIKRKKRKGMEDAYSASLILQSWLDSG